MCMLYNSPLFSALQDENEIEKRVNETLQNSITSRSLRRLKNNNCKRFLLTFREPNVERKVRRKKLLLLYFVFLRPFL